MHRKVWQNNTSKIKCELKDQNPLVNHYNQIHKENIPDKLNNANKVHRLENSKKTFWIIQNNDR